MIASSLSVALSALLETGRMMDLAYFEDGYGLICETYGTPPSVGETVYLSDGAVGGAAGGGRGPTRKYRVIEVCRSIVRRENDFKKLKTGTAEENLEAIINFCKENSGRLNSLGSPFVWYTERVEIILRQEEG